jgi:hypothetical protein
MPAGNARWNPYAGYNRNSPDTLASEGRPYGSVGASSGIGLGFSIPGWAQGLLDGAGAVFGDPLLGQQVAVGGVVVGSLIPGGGNATDQGRLARCNVYLAGALAGIVDSARYLLGTLAENRPNTEHGYYVTALAKLQAARPDVYEAAVAAGPLDDGQTPGYNGLRLLSANGMGINLPGMGTFDGKMVPQNQPLVTQLIALAANPKTPPLGNIPSGSIVKPGQVASASPIAAVTTALGGLTPVELLAIAAVGFLVLKKSKVF